MLLATAGVSPLTMAASSLKASLTLEVMGDEGRPVLRRQGSLTPGSPKVDWRATSPRVGGGQALRRAQSVGSALSEFIGGRKALEESSSAMRRSGSRGCLESLEAGSNARAALDGEERRERLEEDREWNFMTLRPGGMLHRDTFPSPQFLAQEPWQGLGKSGKEALPRSGKKHRRAASTGQKSIVFEQAQESFDSLKDRLESSLKMQPECSYVAPPSAPLAPANVVVLPLIPLSPPCKDVGVLGLAKDVKLSTLPRSLKRRKKEQNARSCAMSNAFSALVFIIKSMHGHALDARELVTPMQRDMDLSFAWLFQQVFASTPEYMLGIMVLLAEFTVHSLGEDMALASALAMSNSKAHSPLPAKEGVAAGLMKELNRRQKSALAAKNEGIAGAKRESVLDALANAVSGEERKISPEEEKIMHALMVEAMEEMQMNSGWQPLPVVEKEAMKKLVAPVEVTVSADNYTCFDRTELEYQHALRFQPSNVMLLSNYAQFLYTVRHDNNRAEEYFHRAIRADPSDVEVLGRFATFLWLGRGDNETAERAFRAAAALDPTNPYHAGNYSHFLWHSEDSKYLKCATTCFVGSE